MNYIKVPTEIEKRSMEIIAPHLEKYCLSPEETKVYSRIIHASGDPAYASIIQMHPEAISAARQAILNGCDIYTDVEMVRTGINKKKLASYGGKAHCLIADEKVAELAKSEGITRSMAAIRTFGQKLDQSIVAIGNAPTALFELLHIMETSAIRPAVIIGIPVGFVGASESKQLLETTSPVPFITVRGNKGGSPIAAAAVNALLYMLS